MLQASLLATSAYFSGDKDHVVVFPFKVSSKVGKLSSPLVHLQVKPEEMSVQADTP